MLGFEVNKVESMNTFKYKTRTGFRTGTFNIYQGKDGAIYLLMGTVFAALTYKQVCDLFINCYELNDFDELDFAKYYEI